MLTRPEDYSTIRWVELGFDSEVAWRGFLELKMAESYLWLKQQVPAATLNDAANALIANAADNTQQALFYAEFYMTLRLIRDIPDVPEVDEAKVGSVSFKQAPGANSDLAERFLRKAWKYLRLAGFNLGGINVGLRSGTPVSN